MSASWLVTPCFFDQHDPALVAVVPTSSDYVLNDPGCIDDRTPDSLLKLHRPIASFVAQAAGRNETPISVAGDCAASLPVMAGLQRAGLDSVLVWLDAHGDFNTIETSPSGFLGGMPLAMMVGRGDMSICEGVGLAPVAEEDVWLSDARDLDPLEKVALDSSHVNRFAFESLAELTFERPIHLHIDNDVIDANDVPANNYPVPGGPDLSQVIATTSEFVSRNLLAAISLSGWNGRLDHSGKTGRACRTLLNAIVSRMKPR